MSTPWSVGRFDGSETFQLRCLFPEDLLIHFRTPFLGGSPAVLDFWIMRGGEPLVMTASEADFPPGFELHPTEARNKFAYRMLERIRAGWKPGEVMTAPNIWPVQGGDRLVLMGRRSMSKSGAFFGLFEFDTCALVYWLTSDRAMPGLEEAMGVCPSCEDAVHAGWMRTAFEFVQSRGTSWVIDTEWRLG